MKPCYLIILLSLFCCAANSIAAPAICDCLPVSSVAEAKKSATLVFSGRVTEKTRVSSDQFGEGTKLFKVNFRVIKSWKGKPSVDTTVWTFESLDNCGVDFKKDESYLVYAIGAPVALATACARTILLYTKQAEDDIASLGTARFPE